MLEAIDCALTHLAQEAERRRLARELHDGVVQSLTALVADLEYFRARRTPACDDISQEMAAKLELWQTLARESLTAMRHTLGDLRQPAGATTDLKAALSALVQDLRAAGYQVTYECEDWPLPLPLAYTTHLYAIAREAVTNSCKHAQATAMTLFLFTDEGKLHVSIGDNGVGMQLPAFVPDTSGHQQGLIGVRERAALLGGQLCIESAPGRGTRIDVELPCPWPLAPDERVIQLADAHKQSTSRPTPVCSKKRAGRRDVSTV